MTTNTPAAHVKARGLSGLKEMAYLCDKPTRTLTDWYYNQSNLFETVLLGCLHKKYFANNVK